MNQTQRADNPSNQSDLLAWRERYEARLSADDGWLTVTGLHWLDEGVNTVGVDVGNDVLIQCSSGAPALGEFRLDAGDVTFTPDPAALERHPELARSQGLVLPADGTASERIRFGACSLVVLRRAERVGVRVYDNESALRRDFEGVHWFPLDPAFSMLARFEAYERPRLEPMLNIVGQVNEVEVPGELHFELAGESVMLLPTVDGDRLFIVFRDGTSGNETYAAARFLTAPLPEEGQVPLDFNRAYHPPCAYTPHATCPLPLAENRLDFPIGAGERLPPG